MVGATLGGVVAALLGRDAVFLLNALSFVVSAALIWRMRFAEPHAEGGRPFRARELVDFSPILAGIRYVRAHVRLRATVFVKFGNLIIGPGWVLFTVMGQNEFAVRWHGMAPERGAFLGIVWVFSTTLLQMQSDDKFRGRVFAADLGLCMFTIAAGAYLAGRFVDWGFAARHVASVAGMLMLLPAGLWGVSLRRNQVVE